MERKLADFKSWQGGPVTVFLLLPILFLCGANVAWADPEFKVEGNSQKTWSFDSETAGTLPSNFLVGTLVDGRSAGKWQVIDMKTSLSLLGKLDRADHARISKALQSSRVPSGPHVFAQLKNGGYTTDYNIVLVGDTTATDFDLKVSFLPIAGKADMGGGLVWRAKDHQNYYITRANPLEQNIRIYRVVNGVRYELENFNHIISVKTWHTLMVVARGSRFQIFLDEQSVLDVRDETFQAGGKIGLWTKADAVTFFDDLQLSIVK